jgi:hypothetical protein
VSLPAPGPVPMGVNLSDDDLRAAYFCAAEVVRISRLGGRPISAGVRSFYDRLGVEIRVRLSRSRQEFDCVPEQLSVDRRIGAAEAAMILGWSKRQVQRRCADLDGEKVGGRYLFRESIVTEYAEEKHDARSAQGSDRAAPL